jgi:hypothetical protein
MLKLRLYTEEAFRDGNETTPELDAEMNEWGATWQGGAGWPYETHVETVWH